MEQGKFAALNVLETNIENPMIPFAYYSFFDETLFRMGVTKEADSKCFGDLKGQDFICYYYVENVLLGAISQGLTNNKKTLLLREALKSDFQLSTKTLFEDDKKYINELFHKLRESERVGC